MSLTRQRTISDIPTHPAKRPRTDEEFAKNVDEPAVVATATSDASKTRSNKADPTTDKVGTSPDSAKVKVRRQCPVPGVDVSDEAIEREMSVSPTPTELEDVTDPEEIRQELIRMGIKIRDYAYQK